MKSRILGLLQNFDLRHSEERFGRRRIDSSPAKPQRGQNDGRTLFRNSPLKWSGFLFVVLILSFYSGAQAQTGKDFYEQGQQAYSQGDYQEAIDLYEKTVELDPNFARAYNALGLAHKEIHTDLSEVAWLFKTATEIDPKYAEAYDNLGKVYYGLGDFDQAEQSCLKALAISPNLPSAKLSLGWIYLLGKSQPPEAISYFKEVLKNNKIAYAYFGLGMAYFMNGDRPNVLETITTLRSMEKEDLALQLENMVREGHYVGQQKGTPLVNIEPKGDSTLVASSRAAAPSAEGKTMGTSMMRVRLRGKIFSTGASTSAIDRIKNLRATAGTSSHIQIQSVH